MSGSLRDKSDSCWKLAIQLQENANFNNCANRMYYAVFQAVKDYAVKAGLYAKTDYMSAHTIMRKIVKSKLPNQADSYEDMSELRKTADYDPDDVPPGVIDSHFVGVMQSIRDFFLKEAEK